MKSLAIQAHSHPQSAGGQRSNRRPSCLTGHFASHFFLGSNAAFSCTSYTFFIYSFCFQEQYELVHKAIAQLFEKQLELLESPTNAQIHDGMVGPARRARRLALLNGRMCLSNTLWSLLRGRVGEITQIISHRGRGERKRGLQKSAPSTRGVALFSPPLCRRISGALHTVTLSVTTGLVFTHWNTPLSLVGLRESRQKHTHTAQASRGNPMNPVN